MRRSIPIVCFVGLAGAAGTMESGFGGTALPSRNDAGVAADAPSSSGGGTGTRAGGAAGADAFAGDASPDGTSTGAEGSPVAVAKVQRRGDLDYGDKVTVTGLPLIPRLPARAGMHCW